MIDAFGSDHSADNPVAIAAFSAAVAVLANHRPQALMHLETALVAAPELTAAHALAGMTDIILASTDRLPHAAKRLAQAQKSLAKTGGGTAFEAALVTALAHAVAGRLKSAADVLDDFLYRDPNAFVAAKLSHALRFLTGDADGMVSLTARLSLECERTNAGYGYLLGCHAFGLEETGRLHEAERVGRAALAVAPDDAWALHAVAHVFETRGQTADGIAWLESHRDVWSQCNNFSRHVAWHLALFSLESGDHDGVLAIYDRDIGSGLSSDFRDFANAASMLWRLRQLGIDAGERRWAALADIASEHARDAALVFAQMHYLIALIGAGRLDEAGEFAEDIHDRSRANTDQANVARNAGAELAFTLVQTARGGSSEVSLGFLARRLSRLGGSHAQRDVFLRSLAQIAQGNGDDVGLRQVLAVRRRHRADDGFLADLLGRASRAPTHLPRMTGDHS